MTLDNNVSITLWHDMPKGEYLITPNTVIFHDEKTNKYSTTLSFRPSSKAYGKEEGKEYNVPFITADGSELWKSSGKKENPTNHILHYMEEYEFTIRCNTREEVRWKMSQLNAALGTKDLPKGQFVKMRVTKRIYSTSNLLDKRKELKAAIAAHKSVDECMKIANQRFKIDDFNIVLVELSKNAAGQRVETEIKSIFSTFNWNKAWAASAENAAAAAAAAAPTQEKPTEDLPF